MCRDASQGKRISHSALWVSGRLPLCGSAWLVHRWLSDPTIYAPPGGETVIQLRDRVVRALERWQTRCPETTILWAVHGGVIEVLLCHLLGVDLKLRWQFLHENASITEIDLNGKDVTVVRLNEITHLHENCCS